MEKSLIYQLSGQIDIHACLMYTPYMDLDLYRPEVRVSTHPVVGLSAIDISPDHPQRTVVFIPGFGGPGRTVAVSSAEVFR